MNDVDLNFDTSKALCAACSQIRKQQEDEERAKEAEVERARSFATALQTIGVIKIAKKVRMCTAT